MNTKSNLFYLISIIISLLILIFYIMTDSSSILFSIFGFVLLFFCLLPLYGISYFFLIRKRKEKWNKRISIKYFILNILVFFVTALNIIYQNNIWSHYEFLKKLFVIIVVIIFCLIPFTLFLRKMLYQMIQINLTQTQKAYYLISEVTWIICWLYYSKIGWGFLAFYNIN